MEENKYCGNCFYSHDKDGESKGYCRLIKKNCSSSKKYCAGWQWVNFRKMGCDQSQLLEPPLKSHSNGCCWDMAINYIIHKWDDKKGYYIMSKSKNFTFDVSYCPFCGVKLSDVKN